MRTHTPDINKHDSAEKSVGSGGYVTYHCPNHVSHQIEELKQIFPQIKVNSTLSFFQEVRGVPYPDWVEDWCVFLNPTVFSGENAALHHVFRELARRRSFSISRAWEDVHEVDEYSVPHTTRVRAAFLEKSRQSSNDIYMVPCQLGLRYRGVPISPEGRKLSTNEYGLSILEAATFLLLHPMRLRCPSELAVGCAGSVYTAPSASGGEVVHHPIFYHSFGGDLEFSADPCGNPFAISGEATAFIPERFL